MKIKLLKIEQTEMMRENSITKICFFEGHHDTIYDDVKERVLKLLASNPWLPSRIVKENKEVMMAFDETQTPDELIDQILHLPIFNPKSIFCDFGVIYKAKDNRTAIFYFSKKTSIQHYLANSELGESVSESLFN
ncbi:MAG: hypothetical protein JEZ14_25900 [Marinilabiliaceae bacterium]|nr:hypothetical protein [Marinilabiliaceae bacterium]